MHFVFIGLHLIWLALMTYLATLVRGNPFVDSDFLIAVCAVVSGCLSVWFARRMVLAIVVAIPYFFGLAYLVWRMIVELKYVIDHGIDAASTYGTFGLALLSIGLWIASVWFRSRTHQTTAEPLR